MANPANLLISNNDGVYNVIVSGRATFECAPPLRDLAKKLDQLDFTEINIDLKRCAWMDSTFMGVLAMLGLRARKVDATVNICNADEQCQTLLIGLGLKKLFEFVTADIEDLSSEPQPDGSDEKIMVNAETVLDAHKVLMDVDEQNVKKFERVVDMVQKDIDKMNEKNSK